MIRKCVHGNNLLACGCGQETPASRATRRQQIMDAETVEGTRTHNHDRTEPCLPGCPLYVQGA